MTRSFSALVEAARDMSPVAGLTHNFYRYPARFSPKFVRATIEAFSAPGDLVLDPFMGGGTTLVEALALGRHAVGADISSLATFISEAKTTLYSEAELAHLAYWASRVAEQVNVHAKGQLSSAYLEAGYLRYLDGRDTWRLRKAIEQALASATRLAPAKLETFGRCAVLRTAQWALDGRKNLPSVSKFRETLTQFAASMVEGARELRQAAEVGRGSLTPIARCLTRSTAGLETDPIIEGLPRPALVITSPPYPGVHVLYHRWQVDGRKETPAPFWIANKLDGSGAAYYTMGDRHAYQLKTYFNHLRESLRSVAAVCTGKTAVVQVVAFSDPAWQLPRYLAVADDAGLTEFRLPNLKGVRDGRLWRTVPNRKWYADQRGETSGSQEVVLFHRKR
jgi:DNA methylase